MAIVTALLIAPPAIGAGSSAELAIARAINVRATDVPGFTAAPSSGTSGSPFGPQVNNTCSGLVGAGARRRAAHANSPDFVRSVGLRTQSVRSEVEIEASRRIAMHDLAVGRSRHTRVCIKRILESLTFSQDGTRVTLTRVRVTALRVSIPGTGGSFGLRVKAVVSAGSGEIPFSVDMIGIAVGRDEISLITEGVDEALPRATEQRLSQLLASRALALPH